MVDKHDLVHELPEYRDQIHELKMNDHHFQRLFTEYHDLDHEIHRIEQGVENTSDEYLETKKKERLALKDAMYHMLQKAAAS